MTFKITKTTNVLHYKQHICCLLCNKCRKNVDLTLCFSHVTLYSLNPHISRFKKFLFFFNLTSNGLAEEVSQWQKQTSHSQLLINLHLNRGKNRAS